MNTFYLVAQTVFAAGAIAFAAYVFVCIRQTRRRVDESFISRFEQDTVLTRIGREDQELRAEFLELAERVEQMSIAHTETDARLAEMEQCLSMFSPSRPVPNSLNIDRRAEVERKLQFGVAAERISEELEVPLSAVRLIAHLCKASPGRRVQTDKRSAAA